MQIWCAQDALVLKAMALVLGKTLEPVLSMRCFHVKGRGGAKASVRETLEHLTPECHVMKSDVKGYYANIDHDTLYDLLAQYVDDTAVLRLVWLYMQRTIMYGGNYWDVTKGISLGCPLSPLMGALYLAPLDQATAELKNVFYARFMDDGVVIASTRWTLRKAICRVNQVLNRLKVEQHPDKTFIGRGRRGFDFLGYAPTPDGLQPAVTTLTRFTERLARLYEQGADAVCIGQFVRHWLAWLRGGIMGLMCRWDTPITVHVFMDTSP